LSVGGAKPSGGKGTDSDTLTFCRNNGALGARSTHPRPEYLVVGMLRTLPLLVLLGAAPSAPQIDANEAAITSLVLQSFMNVTYGGDGIAEPQRRRSVLLHQTTIAPSGEQLRVRVFSPANEQPEELYRQLRKSGAVADLQRRSKRSVALATAPDGFTLGHVHRAVCGPEYDRRKWKNAIAVSRPGFAHANNLALLYVEYRGSGRAYLLERMNGAWKITAYVELWECG